MSDGHGAQMIPALLTFAGLASLGGMAYGILLVFAATNLPTDDDKMGWQGIRCFLVSLVVLAAVITYSVWRAHHG